MHTDLIWAGCHADPYMNRIGNGRRGVRRAQWGHDRFSLFNMIYPKIQHWGGTLPVDHAEVFKKPSFLPSGSAAETDRVANYMAEADRTVKKCVPSE